MQAPNRASEEYEAQKRLATATMLAVRSQWSGMGGDWTAAFGTVGPRMAAIVTAGQVASARQGAVYVPEVLAEQGMYPRSLGRVNAAAFAGRAADGRDLTSLLERSVVHSRSAGTLDAGRDFLDQVVQTELEDAHRGAIQAATVARPKAGYVRMVNTPCCKDCAVLAGKFYKANTGFLRHPNCRCFHVPTTDPSSQYATYPEPSEVTGLTDGERKALDAGGDWSQVVNASRGRDRTRGVRVTDRSKMTTNEGTTRRGVAYDALGGDSRRDVRRAGERVRRTTRQRLTPDAIYELSGDDVDLARRLLTQQGYLR